MLWRLNCCVLGNAGVVGLDLVVLLMLRFGGIGRTELFL